MIDQLFLWKLALSFIVGGSYIALTLWVSEKFGSRLGGLITALPALVLVSLLFMAWTQGPEAAARAALVAPMTQASCLVFLMVFIKLCRFGRIKAFLGGVTAWLLLNMLLILYFPHAIGFSLAVAALFFVAAVIFFRAVPHRKLAAVKLTHQEWIFRVLFAGCIVVVAVFLGRVLGPLWGGMAASFPVSFSSSMLILSRKHGPDFTASVAKTMPYGLIGTVFFTVAFHFLVPEIGLGLGTLIAYLVAAVTGYTALRLSKK